MTHPLSLTPLPPLTHPSSSSPPLSPLSSFILLLLFHLLLLLLLLLLLSPPPLPPSLSPSHLPFLPPFLPLFSLSLLTTPCSLPPPPTPLGTYRGSKRTRHDHHDPDDQGTGRYATETTAMFLPKHKLPPAPWDDVEAEASWENPTSSGSLGRGLLGGGALGVGGKNDTSGTRAHPPSDPPDAKGKGKALLRRGSSGSGSGGVRLVVSKRLRGGADRDNNSSQVVNSIPLAYPYPYPIIPPIPTLPYHTPTPTLPYHTPTPTLSYPYPYHYISYHHNGIPRNFYPNRYPNLPLPFLFTLISPSPSSVLSVCRHSLYRKKENSKKTTITRTTRKKRRTMTTTISSICLRPKKPKQRPTLLLLLLLLVVVLLLLERPK